MIISCLGDSLTEGAYGVFGKPGIVNAKKENYPYFLSKIMNAEVRNFGKAGYRASTFLNYYKEGNVDVKDSDVIIIMLGTNGGIDPCDFESYENKCYAEIVELCRADAPNSRIFLCTPPHVTTDPSRTCFGYEDRVKTATSFVRLYAETEGLSVIEAAKHPDFCAENEEKYQPVDGVHFNMEGYSLLADFIGAELKKFLKI